jgi:glycerophosphoryl diester phosphodiesterase
MLPARRHVLSLCASLVAALVLLTSALVLAAPATASAASPCLFAAHRGYTAHAPENSLRAFRYAIARHADYLEMDVQATEDGHFALMHDETVDRTTDGSGRVADMTWAQLRSLRLSDGHRVPSLAQVLALAKPSGTQILLEMKWIPSSRFAALHRVVEAFGTSHVVVHSFSRYVAHRYHSLYPGARTGLDVSSPISVGDAKSFGGVLPDYRHSTDRWISALRSAGVPTYLSTLNTEASWRRFTGKVTLIVTDRAVDYDAYRQEACG